MDAPLLGSILAIISAFSYAVNKIFVRRGFLELELYTGVLTTQMVSLSFFGVLIPALGQHYALFSLNIHTLLVLALAGILDFVIGRSLSYKAYQLLGVNVASPITIIQTPLTVILSIFFLNESITLIQTLGAILVISGIVLVHCTKYERRSHHVSPYTVYWKTGVIAALSGGVAHGISPLLKRVGAINLGSIVSAAIIGPFISYFFATMTCLLPLSIRKYRRNLKIVNRRNAFYFVISGLLTSISSLLIFVALMLAPLSIVGLLKGLSPIFVPILSFLFIRTYEIFNWEILVGTVLAVIGVTLISWQF
ncbi:MAG: EamA family transporter [Candidatus Bathyarchaeia archaeon]